MEYEKQDKDREEAKQKCDFRQSITEGSCSLIPQGNSEMLVMPQSLSQIETGERGFYAPNMQF